MDQITQSVLDEENGLPLMIQPKNPDIDTIQWISGQRAFLEEQLMKYGAVLFRGFPVQKPSQFEALAEAACPDLYGDYGDLPPAEGKVYGVTPYPPDKIILFHNESSHMHRWPTRQFFYCNLPAASGGMTPVVDCRRLYRALDPDLAQEFESKKLKYVRNFIKGVDVSWQDFFKTEDRKEVEAYCDRHNIVYQWKGDDDLATYQIAPAVATHPITGEKLLFNQIQLHHIAFLDTEVRQALLNLYSEEDLPRNVLFGDGKPISNELALELEKLYWDHSVAFPWQSGDVLMVDNMLVAHARNTYEEPRKMYVAMGKIIHQSEIAES